MRYAKFALAAPVLLGLSATQIHAAGLVITPNFGTTITADTANSAAIESTIDDAIGVYEARFTNPITVSLDFEEMTSGLGASNTSLYLTSYNTYRSHLITDKAQGTDNTDFLASLPASGNPVPGQSASGVESSSAAFRALGFNTPGTISVNGVNYDSEISLNTTITNDSRTGPQVAGKYDLQSTVLHEIDEALGVNSVLDFPPPTPPNTFPNGYVGPLDFFRYNATGRSFTKSTSEAAYFSVDGGKTPIVYFNQGANGGDLHDFASHGEPYQSSTRRVQDAFAYPNSAPDLGPAEFTALDVVGYNTDNTSGAPEPSQLAALGFTAFGVLGLILKARRRKAGEPDA